MTDDEIIVGASSVPHLELLSLQKERYENKESYIGIWNDNKLIFISVKEYEYLKFVAYEIANKLVH